MIGRLLACRRHVVDQRPLHLLTAQEVRLSRPSLLGDFRYGLVGNVYRGGGKFRVLIRQYRQQQIRVFPLGVFEIAGSVKSENPRDVSIGHAMQPNTAPPV